MTTQQDERAEWLNRARGVLAASRTSGGVHVDALFAIIEQAATILEADAKGGEAVAEWHLDSEAAQFLAELITAGEDGPTEISLRVGQIKDDDGTVKHGLLVYETEYPEEGASLLVECPPLYTHPQQAAQVPLSEELEAAYETLAAIGDYAHHHSTGPAVPDALWEVRRMAYDAVAPAISADRLAAEVHGIGKDQG